MQFNMSAREFDLLIAALDMSQAMMYEESPAKAELSILSARFRALWYQIKDDTSVDVLYPKVVRTVGCGDSCSRP